MAAIGLPVPNISQISEPGVSALEEVEFSGHLTKPAATGGVGSGKKMLH